MATYTSVSVADTAPATSRPTATATTDRITLNRIT
jgi:hypothetical protein